MIETSRRADRAALQQIKKSVVFPWEELLGERRRDLGSREGQFLH